MEILGLEDRRVTADRRSGDRRQEAVAVVVERRRGADRRQAVGRRETACGHLRQALQLLEDLLALNHVDEATRRDLTAAVRRLWLALRESELGNIGRHGQP